MTLPIQPTVDPSAPVVGAPSGQVNVETEIRRFAQSLVSNLVPQVEPLTTAKATIDSVSLGDASNPPSITVNLGGTLIPDVRIVGNFTPRVDDTVILVRQGSAYFAVWRIPVVGSKSTQSEGGWITPTLGAGFTHSTTVRYRRVMDNGCWKMQWKGTADRTGTPSNFITAALASEYRPAAWTPVTIACTAAGGKAECRADFNDDGTVTFFSLDTAATWVSLNRVEYFL